MFCPLYRIFILCILFSGQLSSIESRTEPLLEKAQQLFEAALYSQAIPIYQQILHPVSDFNGEIRTIDSWVASRVRLKLAQSYYFLNNYKEVIAVLKDNVIGNTALSSEAQETFQTSLYLSALACRNMNLYEEAIEKFQAYLYHTQSKTWNLDRAKAPRLDDRKSVHISNIDRLAIVQPRELSRWPKSKFSTECGISSEEKKKLPLYDDAQFEIGLSYFQWGNLSESKKYFSSISADSSKKPLYYLACFYLTRIDLLQGNFREAEKTLSTLSPQLSSDDALRYELAYLQGETSFQLENYSQATEYFIQAFPKNNCENCPWYNETLYHLGWCYLKKGDDPNKTADEQILNFKKAAESFQVLLERSPEEKVYLALGQCYLTRARCLKEESAYAQAEALLSRQEVFLSREAQAHALLLRAEAAASYAVRDKFYRQLTQESNSESIFYAKGWYLRGLNDFEEGEVLLAEKEEEEAKKAFERAVIAFEKAFEGLRAKEKTRAALALKYQVQAHEKQNTPEGRLAAFSILEVLLNQYPDIFAALENPDEVFYLRGFVASQIAAEGEHGQFAEIAMQSLQQGIAQFPQGKFADLSLNLLGTLHYRSGEYAKAEHTYLQLANDYPRSPYAGGAWFWAANCSEELKSDPAISKKRRQIVFENYSESLFAAEAYFTYYTYREYIQGDRAAIKHLQGLAIKYSDSPFLIQAHYLIGLDYKRDRKTAEGKWIRKKNLTAAIDAFQEVESVHDVLSEKRLIPEELRDYYLMVRYRATLERALANLAIAEESLGAKRHIYLEYAEEVFQHLVNDFDNPRQLLIGESYPQIQEESSFWLAQTYIKAQNDEAAEKIFSKMLDHYRTTKTTKGYFLSRVWYEHGMIALRRKEYSLALQCFKHAEDAAKGSLLNTDQKLDLWIQESYCNRGLNQWDQAILILSKVINHDAISNLRLKAMYLRAEIYELQERPELARKQLQTTAKKGGEWAMKAKEKLEKDYGY